MEICTSQKPNNMNSTTAPFTDIPSTAGRPKSDFLLAIEKLPVGHKMEVQFQPEDSEGIKILRSIIYKHSNKTGRVVKSRRIGGNKYAFYRVS